MSGCHAGGGRAGGNVFITANGGTVSNCVIRNGHGLSNWDSGGGGVVSVQKGRVLNCTIAGNKSDFSCACAPDGRVVAVLVNWTRKPQPYELKTPDLTISGTLSPRGWQCVERAK